MTSTFTTLRRAAVALAITALLPASAFAQGQDLRSPDARDAANGRYLGSSSQHLDAPDARVTSTGSPSGGGVDWASAGIGAASFGGLVLLGAGGWAAVVTLRRRRPTT